MTPTGEGWRFKDFGEDQQIEAEGWKSTDHYTIKYFDQIIDLALHHAEPMTDAYLEDRQELENEFWAGWVEASGMLKMWLDLRKHPSKRLNKRRRA